MIPDEIPGKFPDDHVAMARAVYDASAGRYLEFAGAQLGPTTETALDLALLDAFVDLLGTRPRLRVADVGCGPGRAAAYVAARGIDVVGVDVSPAMLTVARRQHPAIPFHEGRLDDLPFDDGSLDGAVCWYSVIHTPPAELRSAFVELRRVLDRDGVVLLAFQAGDGEAVRRADAHRTGLPLTSFRHGVDVVVRALEESAFEAFATAVRQPVLEHETTPQAFVIARASEPAGTRT